MSDLTPEERDELASAYLDGEATAEERAKAEADPALLARVEQFRHSAAEVASPVAEAGREEIIAQALKALKPADAKPAKLSAGLRRSKERESLPRILLRDRLSNRRLAPIFSVAAVLVVVFLAISIVVLLTDDTGEDDYEADAPATTQALEPEQLLESAEFQAAPDEVFAASAATAALTAAPTTAAAPTSSPSADDAAAETAADVPASTSALAPAAPSADGRASQGDSFGEADQGDMGAGGPPLELPEETEPETEAYSSRSADFADADARTGECPTEENLEAPPEDDDSESELEEEEEPSPSDPDAIERSVSPTSEVRPDAELEISEPPSVAPSPPADSSADSSSTVPSPDEDALLVECP